MKYVITTFNILLITIILIQSTIGGHHHHEDDYDEDDHPKSCVPRGEKCDDDDDCCGHIPCSYIGWSYFLKKLCLKVPPPEFILSKGTKGEAFHLKYHKDKDEYHHRSSILDILNPNTTMVNPVNVTESIPPPTLALS